MSAWGKIFSSVSIIAIAVLISLLFLLRNIAPEAMIALLGVLIGSLITGFIQYSMSDANRKQQLRLAALDRRLQAHQEAFALWQRLIFTERQTDEFAQTVTDCQSWWNTNCLYLTSEARIAFRKAYHAANVHANLAAMHADADLLLAAWEDVHRAGAIIVDGVGLPSIGDESNQVDKRSTKGDA